MTGMFTIRDRAGVGPILVAVILFVSTLTLASQSQCIDLTGNYSLVEDGITAKHDLEIKQKGCGEMTVTTLYTEFFVTDFFTADGVFRQRPANHMASAQYRDQSFVLTRVGIRDKRWGSEESITRLDGESSLTVTTKQMDSQGNLIQEFTRRYTRLRR